MSALILISHVKKGAELAERYNLGQEIIDIIRQHHGTRIIRYFYRRPSIWAKSRASPISAIPAPVRKPRKPPSSCWPTLWRRPRVR